jgi:Lon protease-like protein
MSVLQPLVPIFSLPSVVLFPRALLHLQIPEDQFDTAMGEWLAEGAVWGVATLRGEVKASPLFDEPAYVFRTVGIGCIVHRERENGCVSRLVLEGMARGRILDGCEPATSPAVQVEILRDHVNVEGVHRKELAQTFSEMLRAARRVAAAESELRDPIRRILSSHPHPGVVADLLAHHCVSDTYARQCILAELDVCRRVHLVQIQLAQMVTWQPLQPLRRFR